MGKANRQRRAAKAKAKAKARAQARHRQQQDGGDWSEGSWFGDAGSGFGFGPHGPGCRCGEDDDSQRSARRVPERERVAMLFLDHQDALGRGEEERAAAILARLARCAPDVVAVAVAADLLHTLAALWGGGWLPGEVLRQARRQAGAHGERVAAFAIAADHARRQPSTLHPRWRAHVADLDLPSVEPGDHSWVLGDDLRRSGRTSESEGWIETVRVAAEVAQWWSRLGRMAETIPPPGSRWSTESESVIDLTAEQASPILAKVRQLLAQAESTTFDAEAEAFTAKAQELMAKHAIDAAMVWSREDQVEEPDSTRIPVDDPYANAKERLLAGVAAENGCRAVTDPHHGLVHLVGFAGDLAWVETLYTSLLVQSQRELTRAGAGERAGGRRRGRGFRASFLSAYAQRIAERLAEVNAYVQRDHEATDDTQDGQGGTEGGESRSRGALVPVLEQRSAAVDDAVDEIFGDGLTHTAFRGGSDPLGWHEGRQAADRAELQQVMAS